MLSRTLLSADTDRHGLWRLRRKCCVGVLKPVSGQRRLLGRKGLCPWVSARQREWVPPSGRDPSLPKA